MQDTDSGSSGGDTSSPVEGPSVLRGTDPTTGRSYAGKSPQERFERNQKILVAYRQGISMRQLAIEFGLTAGRVQQIVRQEIPRASKVPVAPQVVTQCSHPHTLESTSSATPGPCVLCGEAQASHG